MAQHDVNMAARRGFSLIFGQNFAISNVTFKGLQNPLQFRSSNTLIDFSMMPSYRCSHGYSLSGSISSNSFLPGNSKTTETVWSAFKNPQIPACVRLSTVAQTCSSCMHERKCLMYNFPGYHYFPTRRPGPSVLSKLSSGLLERSLHSPGCASLPLNYRHYWRGGNLSGLCVSNHNQVMTNIGASSFGRMTSARQISNKSYYTRDPVQESAMDTIHGYEGYEAQRKEQESVDETAAWVILC